AAGCDFLCKHDDAFWRRAGCQADAQAGYLSCARNFNSAGALEEIFPFGDWADGTEDHLCVRLPSAYSRFCWACAICLAQCAGDYAQHGGAGLGWRAAPRADGVLLEEVQRRFGVHPDCSASCRNPHTLYLGTECRAGGSRRLLYGSRTSRECKHLCAAVRLVGFLCGGVVAIEPVTSR